MTTCLLIINPQRDFIDDRDAALPIKGSFIDMVNLSDMIYEYGDQFDRVVVTLDQHPLHHIAHAGMWLSNRDGHPAAFTKITQADVEAGKWRASVEAQQQLQADYVREVEMAGSPLTIWPQHCITGSRGAAICTRLSSDLASWARPTRQVHFYNLSSNWSTEHISSFRPIVERYDDGTTWFNNYLYSAIQADTIVIAGEALSHQVRATVLDAINYAPAANLASRMIILHDCTSSMDAQQMQGEEFLHEFIQRGGRVERSSDLYRHTLTDD